MGVEENEKNANKTKKRESKSSRYRSVSESGKGGINWFLRAAVSCCYIYIYIYVYWLRLVMSSWESCEDGNLVRTGEIVLFVQNETRYHEGDGNLNYDEGKLTLSTDNIFFQPKGAGPIFLRIPLGNIDSPSGGPTVVAQSDGRSPKLHIPLTESEQKAVFSFKVGNIKEFCETLRDVLQQKLLLLRRSEMLTEPLPSITGVVQGSSKAARDDSSAAPANETLLAFTDKAGIAGLMRASAEKTSQGETLRDIDDVMRNASSLVASIRNLQQKQQNIAGTTKAEDNTTIESIEATLGLGATVRASGAGWGLVSAHAGFHKELAWEIHSWITHEKNHHVFGSMPLIPLIELFSLYNKARGECDLVSTNDVLHACRALDQQEYAQYTLKRLSSGRYALQRKDPSIVLKKLEHILGPRLCNEKESGKFTTSADSSPIHNGRDGGVAQPVAQTAVFPESSSMLKGVNEVTFASVLHVTCSVSMDLLEELELQGYLCRSGGEFGCFTFHWNIFVF